MKNNIVPRAAVAVAMFAVFSTAFAYNLHTKTLPPIREDIPPAGPAIRLVERGELKFAVVADFEGERSGPGRGRATLPEAVRVITNAFARTTGKCPELFRAKDAAKASAKYDLLLLVGNQPMTRELGVDVLALPDQGFKIATFGKGVMIVGKDTKFVPGWNERPLDHKGDSYATYYGAIDFVERFLGVRYYFIGDLGKIYPKCENLVLAPVSYEDAPYFSTRGNNYGFYSPISTERRIARFAPYSNVPLRAGDTSMFKLWRLGGTRPMHGKHYPEPIALQRALVDRAVYEKHFYKSPNGHRWMNEGGHFGNYFDPINLDGFAKEYCDRVKAFLDSQGKDNPWKFNSLVNNTYVNFGVCDTMMKLRDYQDDPVVKSLGLLRPEDLDPALEERAQMRNVYGRFYQYMGERLLKDAPGVRLYCMNYYNSLWAPTDPRWKLPPNVEAMVCDGQILTWAHSPKAVARSRRLFGGWQNALGGRPVSMAYLYDCGNPVAKPIVVQNMGDAVKAIGPRLGRDGVFFDCSVNYHLFFAYYVAAHAQWNPDCDPVAMTEEAFDLCCGPKAGSCLKRFYAKLRAIVTERFDIPAAQSIDLSDREMDELQAILDKGRKCVAEGSAEAKRYALMADYWAPVFERQRVIASYRNPEVKIRKVSDSAVKVDGAADEAFWGSAAELAFMENQTGKPPFVPTSARLAWSDTGVYGFFESSEAPHFDAKKDIWGSDTLEFLLSQGLGCEEFHQYAFDSTGRFATYRRRLLPIPQPYDDQYKGKGFKCACKVENGKWTAEFFVPFSCLWSPEPPKAGDKWRMNIVKTRVGDPKQLDATSLTLGNNANMRMFDIVEFGE